MKIRIISVLLIFLLSISINGCSASRSTLVSNNNSSISDNKIPDGSIPTNADSSEGKSEDTKTQVPSSNSMLEAYKAVLENKAEFFSIDNKKKLYLDDFLTNKEIYETVFKVAHFTILDMDGDKIPEVVLELTVGGNPQFYEVLHYMNGEVYGYNIVYRGLERLKSDGTFTYSSGAADNGCGKLIFELNGYKTDILGYSKSSQANGNLNISISFFIQNKQVTREAFESFINEQDKKKDVTWYEFSQDNIESNLKYK